MTRDRQKRVLSFKGCGIEAARPISLATAGFSFDRVKRAVVCSFCGLTLDSEFLPKDPQEVHKRLKPTCDFVLKTADNLESVGEKGFAQAAYEKSPSPGVLPAITMAGPRFPVTVVNARRQNPDETFLNELRDEFKRMETFHDFPIHDSELIEDLAASGFFFTGRSDIVRCALCGVELDKWSSGDKPEIRHRTVSPQCYLFTGNTSVALHKQNPRESVTSKCTHSHVSESLPGPHPNALTSNSKVSAYFSLDKRLASFGDWPAVKHQTPRELASAGFFYLGSSDNVRCFHCGGVLNQWEPKDVPIEEHTRWFPNCEWAQRALQERKASVNQVHEAAPANQALQNMKVTSSSMPSHAATAAVMSSPQRPNNAAAAAEYEQLVREYEEMVESMQCSICMDAENNVVFMPCGHMACSDCSSRLKQCHICRKNIVRIVNCYL